MEVVALLTKVVQEQQKEMQEQQAQIAALKAEKDAEIAAVKKDNAFLMSENNQLRETLTAMADRQEAIEEVLLALSTNVPNDRLVMHNQAGLNEVQKTIQ